MNKALRAVLDESEKLKTHSGYAGLDSPDQAYIDSLGETREFAVMFGTYTSRVLLPDAFRDNPGDYLQRQIVYEYGDDKYRFYVWEQGKLRHIKFKTDVRDWLRTRAVAMGPNQIVPRIIIISIPTLEQMWGSLSEELQGLTNRTEFASKYYTILDRLIAYAKNETRMLKVEGSDEYKPYPVGLPSIYMGRFYSSGSGYLADSYVWDNSPPEDVAEARRAIFGIGMLVSQDGIISLYT